MQKYGTWPSRSSMISFQKPILVRGTGGVGNEYIFDDMTVPGWPHDVMTGFSEYPKCGGYRPGQWALFGGKKFTDGPSNLSYL